MTKPRVLIVEDEPAIRDNIQFALENEGLETVQLGTGRGVLDKLDEGNIQLVVLDVGLPDISGFDLLKELRKRHRTPVIMLTARNAELDRVLGLEIGADDYVIKPFSPRELSARVKAVLRRTHAAEPTPAASSTAAAPKAFSIDNGKRQVSYHGVQLALSKFEFELLCMLAARPGRVFSREQLMTQLWQDTALAAGRTVDAHIKNLRAKLRAVRPDLDPIITHRGSGYSLREDP